MPSSERRTIVHLSQKEIWMKDDLSAEYLQLFSIRFEKAMQVEVPLYGNQVVIVRIFLFEKQFDVVVGMCAEDKLTYVEQQFVEAYLLHLDLLLLVVRFGKVEQAVD